MSISRTPTAPVVVCASTTRPAAPAEGQMIYETNTDKLYVYSGAAWISLANRTYFDTQFFDSVGSGYSSNITGSSTNYLSDGTNNVEITYTPPVDAWWEVSLRVGIISKIDAAYHYIYGTIELSPAPVTGAAIVFSICTQHSTVDNFMSLQKTHTYKLAANTAYTAKARLGSGSGGSWQYHRDNDYLSMYGKAWAR